MHFFAPTFELRQEALGIVTKVYGPDHPVTARLYVVGIGPGARVRDMDVDNGC